MTKPRLDTAATVEPRVTRQASAAARRAVQEHAAYAAAAAIVPGAFIGSLAVSGLQLKMLARLASVYQVPFAQNPMRTALAAGSGGLLSLLLSSNPVTRVARDFFTATLPAIAVPVRLLAGPVIIGGYSYLLGHAFIRHYENGGHYLNFDWVAFRADLWRKLGLPPLPERAIDI